MKKIYDALVRTLENTIVFLHVFKMIGAENYALYRKKKLYRNINWSKEQKNLFEKFWRKNYGKVINSKGHKLYQSINGVFDESYFPDFLFSTKLEPFLNNYIYARIYSDKSLTELLYSKSEKLIIPKTFLVKISGIWYDSQRNILNNDSVKKILHNSGKSIVKPTIGGNSGKGIIFCNFIDGVDHNGDTTIEFLLDSSYSNFIMQEIMIQHSSFNKLYPHSINTIRIITYIAAAEIHHADLCLRLGTGGAKMDNIHAGGIVVGLSDEGILMRDAYKLGYSDTKITMQSHPDTNIVFEGYVLDGVDEIISTAKELHGLTPHIGIVSWDFMVNKGGKPVLIEANYMGQSIWFPQIVHAKPIFGKHTEYMINLIK